MCAEFADVATRARPDSRVLVQPLAGGLAVYAGPGLPMNKVIGLGLGEALDESALAAVEAEYAARDEAVRVELSTLDDGAIARLLTSRGYRLLGFENVLGRPLSTADVGAPAVAGLAIHSLAPDDLDLFMEVTVDGFAHADEGPLPTEAPPPDALEAFSATWSGVSGFRRYLATINSGGRRCGERAHRWLPGPDDGRGDATGLPAAGPSDSTHTPSPGRRARGRLRSRRWLPRRRGRSRRRTRSGGGSSCCMRGPSL